MAILFTWLNGITALLVAVVSIGIFILCVIYYKRDKNNVYICGIVLYMALALAYTPLSVSFIWLLLNNGNSPEALNSIIWIFMYSGIPAGTLAILYVNWSTIGAPQNKKYILGIYAIVAVIYHTSLYITFQDSVGTNIPLKQGELYDDWLNPISMPYFAEWSFTFIAGTISAIGFRNFTKHSKGKMKKKSILIQISAVTFTPGILGEAVILGSLITPHEHLLWIIRLCLVIGIFLLYPAFKPEKTP